MKKTSIVIGTLSFLSLFLISTASCSNNNKKHHFSEEWTTSEEGHWHECTDEGCDEIADFSPHNESDWIVDNEASCNEDGNKHTECTICHFTMQTQTILATGHNLGDVVYTWSSDNLSCTAKYGCTRGDFEETETTTNILREVKSEANCTEAEVDTLTAVFENSHFINQTKNITVGNPRGHINGEWIVDKEPTCTESGTEHKVCTVCGTITETDIIPATGHQYGAVTYTWSNNNTVCKATRVCTKDGKTETATAVITSTVKSEATCTEEEISTLTATFSESYFETQTKDVVSGAAKGHTSSDWIIDTNPTCTEEGSKHKECTVCHITLESGVIDVLGHNYGTVSYEWSDDCLTCTATRICQRDSSHVESEVATYSGGKITYSVKTQATCQQRKVVTYVAQFTNSNFETQSVDHEEGELLAHTPGTWTVDVAATCETEGSEHKECTMCHTVTETQSIPALGHDYSTVTYTWASDNSTCTAKLICSHNNLHTIEETVSTTSSIDQAADCTNPEYTLFTATFTNESFTTQTKRIQTKGAVGHKQGSWVTDVAATCTTAGSDHRSCTVCGIQLETRTVDALGHSYGTATYTWSDDGTSCTAKKVCAHDASHIISETVDSTLTETTEATCSADGTYTYTATFTNSDFTTQTTKIVYQQALGHVLSSEVTTEATCTEYGEVSYKCSRCGLVTDVKSIAPKGHDYYDATYYVFNSDKTTVKAYRACKNCDYKYYSDEVTITTEVVQELTCTQDEKTYSVAHFNNVMFEDYGGTVVTSKKATGSHTYSNGVCTVCGQKVVELVTTTAVEEDGETVYSNSSTYYKTIKEALEAIPDESEDYYTINIDDDLTEAGFTFEENKVISLNLNEHTLTLSGSTGIIIEYNAEVNITNGSILNNSDTGIEKLFEITGNVTFDTVTLDATTTVSGKGKVVLYQYGGNIAVNNSSIIANENQIALYQFISVEGEYDEESEETFYNVQYDGAYFTMDGEDSYMNGGIVMELDETNIGEMNEDDLATYSNSVSIIISNGTFDNLTIQMNSNFAANDDLEIFFQDGKYSMDINPYNHWNGVTFAEDEESGYWILSTGDDD